MARVSENILKEENMDSMELENIFMDIFMKCDIENERHVQVSKLIQFIAPFIESNDEFLIELKKILDPLGTNPVINYDMFSNGMKIVTAKFSNQLHTSFASNEKSGNKTRLSDHHQKQSTPTKESFERASHRNDFDCGLNISNISSYSYAGSVQSACDPMILNEQINELQYKNKKLSDLLNEVRGQLATSEEVNNNIQHDLDKLKKSRQTDLKLIEDLQKMRIEFEKEREENNNLIKNHNSVTQSLNFYKKENSQHRKKILELETEIQKSLEIINSLRRKEDKLTSKIDHFKHELQVKNNEILSLQENIAGLNSACTKKDSLIKDISEELQNLRCDNSALQKDLDDIINKNTSLKSDPSKSGKSCVTFREKFKCSRSSTPHSSYSRKLLYNNSPIFNSPKTLHMLSSPISPFNNYSSLETSDSSKSTVIEKHIISPINKYHSENIDFVYICPKPHPKALSESDALNLTSSSIDSEPNTEKRASKSLGPEIPLDDECFHDKSNNSIHESLHTELFRASNADCFGSHTYCEHKLKLIQIEEENENLQDQIRKYIEEIDKKNEQVEKYKLLQKENEEISSLNVKLKSDIALIKIENKRYSRLQSKIKKLEDEIFSEKTKSETILMQNNRFQSKINDLSSNLQNLEQKKCDLEKKLSDKDTEANNLSFENKELKTKINELTCKIKNLELIKCQLENNVKELKLKINELKENISQLSSEIKVVEKTRQDLEEKYYTEENNVKELKLKINELNSHVQKLEKCNSNELHLKEHETKALNIKASKLSIIETLEQAKYQLEQKLNKEESTNTELKLKIEYLDKEKKHLEQKLSKEQNIVSKLKLKNEMLEKDINQKLTEEESITKKLKQETEILEQAKFQLEEKLNQEKNITKELKENISQLSSEIKVVEKTRQDLEEKYYTEANNVKELKMKVNELTSYIQKLETSKEEHFKADKEISALKLKLNDLYIKSEILEQEKYQLEEKISKGDNLTKDLKLKISDMCSNQELLEQSKHHLEYQLEKEENKLKSITFLLEEMTNKNRELELQNEKNLSINKKLFTNIENLEKKMQKFRKTNIDLNSVKNELEKSLKVISIQRDSLISHISFTQAHLKECTDILGKNTLEVTKVWKPDLELIMEELPISDFVDEVSSLGVMRVSEGILTDCIKNLKNQTRLTGILLKTLAKIKGNLILADDNTNEAKLMSAGFSPESPLYVTQSTFLTNEPSFSLYFHNSSWSPFYSSMSPECTQADMTEEEGHFSCVELTGGSVSSPTGSVFMSSETEVPVEVETLVENQNGAAGIEDIIEESCSDTGSKTEKEPLKQYRSMSEGTTHPPLFTENGDITLFPNLQDNVLESLGLQNGEEARDRGNERLSEEEIEAKFQTLALIFAIDAKTMAQRRELQRRQRDQADNNFAAEVARLEHGIQRLAPLCVDSETKELVTALLSRLNIIVKAAHRISISTQVYGGVQQEFRVAAAVNLMLVHLRNVQQQRDTARRQLQCTKRMLQENTTVSTAALATDGTPGVVSVMSRRINSTSNGRVVTRRRASIATIPRPLDSPSASGPGCIARRAVRRISADAYSEHSARPWDSRQRPDWIPLEKTPVNARMSRPSRIELGLDLTKIHEGSVESTTNNNEESDSDITVYETPTAVLPFPNLFIDHQSTVREPETFSDHAIDVLTALARFVAYCWNRWMKNGTTREMIVFATFIFIAFSSIMMLNIAIVSKFSKQGTVLQRIPWCWLTWDEFWDLFFDVRNTGSRPY